MIDKGMFCHSYVIKFVYKQSGGHPFPFQGKLKVVVPASRVLTPEDARNLVIWAYTDVYQTPLTEDEQKTLMVLNYEYTRKIWCTAV